MNRISCFSILALLLFHHFSFSQTVDPFSIRYQNQQKGGIVMLANVSVSCTNCAATTSQVPPSGTGQNNNVTMNYVDSDSDPTTFMSSSDSLNLANCSEVLWAGLYWSARVGKTGLAPSTVTNYTLRNQIKIKVGNGAYQNLTADELLDNTVGHQTYHCFKKITSLVQANGVKARYTVADLVTRTGTEVYGGWTIVVVYKNVYQSMRNLTVFDGLANVSSGNSVTIPISGFLTPIVGPVNFELGVVSHDGDRSQTGDQLQFNGVGTTYVNVSDALHPLNDVFNSTIARNAVLTPFRNPSFNNTLGHDASVFFPTNTTFNYIGNNASSANIRITTGNETILTSVVTSVIDVYEPDLRATVYMQDLNGGTVNPGDVLEYTLVGKNIGSDISTGTYMTDTLDVRTTYVPGSISVFYGPNSGLKTDAYLDDQAEYDPVNRVVRVRIGNGANATTGGTVASSSTGLDSTVVKFRVTLVNDCVAFQCDPTLEHKAYIFGSGNISGNAYNNGGLSDLLDANGCPTIANDILSVNVTGCPPINITTNPPICVGDLLTLTAPSSFGGIYSWTGPNAFSSAGQSSISIPNVTSANSGQYAVSINFPSLNCTLDTTKIVTILPNPTIQLASSSNVSCFGGNNGALAITNTGTAPYSYLWTNGNISANPTGLIAGSYSVTVTDANTCFTTATYTVTQPTAVTGVTTATSDFNGFDVSCFGSSNGVANVVASGGTSGYTYLWTNGSTATTAINLPAGTASVTITDANLCTSIIPVTLTQPSDLISSATKTDVSCFSGNNGTIDLSASGGVQPYSYSWSNTQTSQDLSSLTSGTYSVTVTDLNNCQDLLSIAVFQPSAPLTLSQTQQNVLCFNQLTGSVDLTPTGGTAPYSYLWSNGAITQDLSGLGAGNYTVTVTDSKLCTANLTVTITQPAQPISATTAITNVACFGFTTGAIDITVSSGVSPYTYLWSNGAVTADIVNIGAASYGVTITDFNSCSLVLTNLVVNQPASPVQTTVSNVNVACFSGSTGSINITPSGGVSPYTYSWSNGAITQDLINLTAGTYNLVTTDFNGCTKLNSVVISQPLSPLSLAETHLNVLCFNQLTGSIDLTPTGGTAPYSYLWSNGAITQDLSGLGAGNYSVTVRDANLCTANILVTITQPSQAISLSRVITNVACYQESTGSIDLSVLGGTAPYTYSWSNGSINQDLINAPASMYSVLVTDVNGCSAFLSNLTITQPSAPLIVAFVQSDVSCYGGSDGLVATMASGGTAPYTYAWSNGQTTMNINNLQAGNYTLVTTDANGCSFTYVSFVTEPLVSLISSESHENILCHGAQTGSINVSPSGGTMPYTYLWSNGATTEDLFGVSSGTYSLVITDYNLCTNNISVTLAQPLLPITPTTAITNVLCHGQNNGAINLSVVGGSAPYTYLWNNGVILQDLTNYPANSYSVTITDASGCVSTLPNLAITQPSMPLAVNLVGDNINCFAGNDGSIITNITGGTAPYVFQWSNSATTQNPTGLAAGSYSVLITDANNCTISASINLTQPGAPLVVTETHVDILCYGLSTGSANTTVTGGTLPYSYSWNSGQSTEDLTNITSGNYILTVTDAESCTVSVTSVVTQPNAPLTLTETHLDAICLGGIQGSIDLTVSGGTAPYLYTWNNGSNVQDQPNLFAGFYESSVVDANGCSDTIDITILDPTNSLLVTQSITDIVCFAGATGIINLTSSGGTPGYAYSWSTGAATEDVSGLEAGNYWVTVSDANSCGIFLNFSVQESPTPIVVSSVVSNVLCIGDMNGAINASVSGGISPYTYSWSNGPLTQDISAIGAGNYTLNVTDNIGCVSSYNATVLQLSQVTINETHNNVACFGENSGSIDVTPVGGIPNLTYLWSNGATTQDLFLLTPGTYSLSLTDGLGCVTPLSVVITQPAAPLLVMNSITNVSCFGNSNGMLDITVSGGTTPYVYTWNNGTSTEDQLGIVAGIYLLNVTDVNGCEILDSYTITQPSFLDVTYTSVNVNCFGGNNGSINLSVSGGEIPYSYSWSNGAIVQDINNLTAGVYTVIVRDAYNCQQVIPITIAQPLAPLSVTESHSNIACFGQSTGTIDILPAGGTFPYTFNWSNSATTEDLTGLPIGNYSVLVTDIQGCTTSIATTLTQPSSPLIFSNNLTDVLCFSDSTGAISITTSGGALPYSYVWSNGAVTEDLNNITAGIYTFNLTDAGGCQILDTFTINQPTQLDVSLVSSNVSCFGGNNGAIDVTAVGGTAPYVYAWSNGQNSQDISQLFTGTYSLVVTDANNCSKTVSVFITQPALPLGALETHVNILCFGNATGSIDISPNGGTPSYTYSWSNGATTQDLTGVVAGNYSLIITDSLGCTFNISATLTEPLAPLSIVSSVFNVSCFGGTNGIIDVAVNGGTAPYSYVWSNGSITEDLNNVNAGVYSFNSTDANGCQILDTFTIDQPTLLEVLLVSSNVSCFGGNNGAVDVTAVGGTAPYSYAWSNGENVQDISQLLPGMYSLLVTDANNCTKTVSSLITQPALPLTAIESHVNILCFGNATGSIDITPNGGTPSYSYSWSNGATTQDLTGVAAGNYSLIITDSLGCTFSILATLTQPLSPLSIVSSVFNVSCFGGSNGRIDVAFNGGTAPYTFVWSNGATTQNLSNLIAGTYTITVTDQHGCVLIETYTVTQPNPLQITWVVDDVNCFAGNDGAIDLTILGGTAPYSYIWSNSQMSQDVSGLIAGTYSVLVTDIKGCFADSTITVAQPAAPLSITENHVNVLCYGNLTGSINVTVAGGTPGYDYLWSNGSVSEDLTNVAAGFYSVAITDSLGCTISISTTITEPAAPLFISNTTTNVSCFGGSDGILDITVSGGTTPYAYLWSNTSVSQDLANLVSGLYTITVTDSNACVSSQTYNVTQPLLPLSSAVNMTPVICFDDATGAAYAFANGGTAPYNFLWSNGVTADSNVNIVADLYYVIVTDTNGCTSTSFITVTEPPLLEIQISGVDVLCNGDSTGSVSVSATGGVGFYQYIWDTNDTTSTVNNLPAGYYNVIVSDANGCQTLDSITILQPLNPLSATFNVTNNLCFGESNGAIDATIAGGTIPYDIDWSNSATSEDLANLIIGDYTLVITDSNNCVLTSVVTIDEPDLIEIVNPILENVSCNDFVDGSINLTTIGGVGQYTYNWSNGAQTEDLNNIISGSYFVVVEDGNNCIQIFDYTLTQPDTINTTYTLVEPSCFAYTDGEINTTTTGGTTPYVLNWSNSASTSLIQPVGAGNYTLEITDANGCFHETQITLGQPEQIQVTLDADVFVGCDPLEVNFANNSDEQYSSNWYFGDASVGSGTQISHTYTGSGSYDVTLVITGANGCSNFAEFSDLIDVLPTPVAGINASTVYLNAAEPEAIILNTSEGATSYVWNLGDSPTDYTFYEPVNYTYPVYNQDEYLVTLVAIGLNGCTDSTQVLIEFDNRLIIYVPNSFTPNGDELNNVFKPIVPVPVKSYHFQIYNRWGELIFETFDKEEGWDGKFNGQLVQDGTYTWEISIVTSKADLFINTGNVNLFR